MSKPMTPSKFIKQLNELVDEAVTSGLHVRTFKVLRTRSCNVDITLDIRDETSKSSPTGRKVPYGDDDNDEDEC